MNPAIARQLDFLGVGIVLLIIWQGLFLWIGETGISSPLQTVRHLVVLSDRPMFWKHAWATLDAFLRSLVIAAAGVVLFGFPDGLAAGTPPQVTLELKRAKAERAGVHGNG